MEIKDIAFLQKFFGETKLQVEGLSKNLGAGCDYIRKSVLADKLIDSETTSVRFEGIGLVITQPDMYVSVLAASRDDLHEWLSDRGHAELITVSVNPASLKALMGTYIKSGAELPPESIVKITPFTKTVIKK